jgi:hypothetical protein
MTDGPYARTSGQIAGEIVKALRLKGLDETVALSKLSPIIDRAHIEWDWIRMHNEIWGCVGCKDVFQFRRVVAKLGKYLCPKCEMPARPAWAYMTEKLMGVDRTL